MAATRILWGQVFIVLMLTLGALVAATLATAAALGYHARVLAPAATKASTLVTGSSTGDWTAEPERRPGGRPVSAASAPYGLHREIVQEMPASVTNS